MWLLLFVLNTVHTLCVKADLKPKEETLAKGCRIPKSKEQALRMVHVLMFDVKMMVLLCQK